MSENTIVGKSINSPVAQGGRFLVNPIQGASEFATRQTFKVFDSPRKARNAQESLENQRRSQLDAEAAARASAKARAATAGTRAGRATSRSGFLSNLGFGGSQGPARGLGRGNLFGN